MNRTIILYGLALAALVLLLKVLEYNFYFRDLSIEFYVGVLAILFTILGGWAGSKLARKKIIIASSDFVLNEPGLQRLGISKRELDVLQLMAEGMSNQEIADKLFVSLNTIKTHIANLFLKLEVSRRTQAIQKAKGLRLIP